ncbi:hypothetical protein Ancab_025248 [Ancistrocladus abbreviatus]
MNEHVQDVYVRSLIKEEDEVIKLELKFQEVKQKYTLMGKLWTTKAMNLEALLKTILSIWNQGKSWRFRRNQQLFQSMDGPLEKIWSRASNVLKDYKAANVNLQNQKSINQHVHWTPPTERLYKMNTNAATNKRGLLDLSFNIPDSTRRVLACVGTKEEGTCATH